MTVGRKMRMFYFIKGGLTLFKNKSKGLGERKKTAKRIMLL